MYEPLSITMTTRNRFCITMKYGNEKQQNVFMQLNHFHIFAWFFLFISYFLKWGKITF